MMGTYAVWFAVVLAVWTLAGKRGFVDAFVLVCVCASLVVYFDGRLDQIEAAVRSGYCECDE